MGRNRIIYQSLALYAGQNSAQSGIHTGIGAIQQLTRVQSWDSDFSRNFTDVTQYGQLAPIDRIEVEAPTVNMSTSWYPTDGFNEKTIATNKLIFKINSALNHRKMNEENTEQEKLNEFILKQKDELKKLNPEIEF